MNMLQQANAHLVIATIEAHKMAEQIRIGKDQLAHLAHHDVLTGLPNRILLNDRLSLAIELAGRQGWQLALMFMDLDRFKHINDSLGHTVGDQLLQSVAQCLVGCARHSDTISRQGGDEFVMLIPFIENAVDAALCAQRSSRRSRCLTASTGTISISARVLVSASSPTMVRMPKP